MGHLWGPHWPYESPRDGLAAQANSRHNWYRSRKCIRLVHKFIVKSTITTQNDQNHKTNLRISLKCVLTCVRHRKLQKYSTCLKAIAETNQLQRCTTDTDCAPVILGGSTKQTKFRDKMRPSNLREAYPQIKYVSHRSILNSCLVFKRMQIHHCIVWHNRYNIQYTKWFYRLLITYMNECSAPPGLHYVYGCHIIIYLCRLSSREMACEIVWGNNLWRLV